MIAILKFTISLFFSKVWSHFDEFYMLKYTRTITKICELKSRILKSDTVNRPHIRRYNFGYNTTKDLPTCGILYKDTIFDHNDGQISKIQNGRRICTTDATVLLLQSVAYRLNPSRWYTCQDMWSTCMIMWLAASTQASSTTISRSRTTQWNNCLPWACTCGRVWGDKLDLCWLDRYETVHSEHEGTAASCTVVSHFYNRPPAVQHMQTQSQQLNATVTTGNGTWTTLLDSSVYSNKKAQLMLSNPRDVNACKNCSNSTCFVSFQRIPFPLISNYQICIAAASPHIYSLA